MRLVCAAREVVSTLAPVTALLVLGTTPFSIRRMSSSWRLLTRAMDRFELRFASSSLWLCRTVSTDGEE